MRSLQDNFLFHNGLKMDKEFNYTLEYLLHGLNVGNLCLRIGEELDLRSESKILLYYSGLFHDMGKSLISESVLFKKGKLDRNEREIINWHPFFSSVLVHSFISYDKKHEGALRDSKNYLLRKLPKIILYHHEDYDGGGYPLGLKGKQIPYLSRILRIVDVFDSLLSERVYREKSYSLGEALDIMDDMAETKFDKILYFEHIRGILVKYQIKGGS